MSDVVLAVDVGGSRLRVAVYGVDGEELYKVVVATPRERPEALVEVMGEAVRAVGDAAWGSVACAVVGMAGFVIYRTGTMVRMPHLPVWESEVSAAQLAKTLGIPVVLANDADLAAVGEHRYGAGRGVDDMVYMTVSTGIGAGVVVGGELLRGRRSMAEVGHTILYPGTAETVEERGSGTALAQVSGSAAEQVAERAWAGEPLAVEQFRQAAEAVAVGVYNLAYCFMPERVVIGGGLSQTGGLLLDPVRERIAQGVGCSVGPGDVVLAEGGDDAGLLGGRALGEDFIQFGADDSRFSLPVFRP